MVGIPLAEYTANKSARAQITRGLLPALVFAILIPELGFLNLRY